MRFWTLPCLLFVACAAGPAAPTIRQVAAGVPDAVLQELQRLAAADCPRPPELYALDGTWYEGWFATVVAIADGAVALRMDEPRRWSADVQHLLLTISPRAGQGGILGDAIVVGRTGDVLICRYFPSSLGPPASPALGDQGWVDHATSRQLRDRRVESSR